MSYAAILLWRQNYGWAILGLIALLFGVAWTSPRADSDDAHKDVALTVVTANLHVGNADTTPLRRWVQEIHADLVVIQEVSPTTATQLEQWETYPFRVITPEEGPFGLAILSRYPLLDTEALETDGQTLRFRTHILWQGRTIALAAIHPMPPISPEYHLHRAQLLATETNWAAETELPAVVAGDFNATPWSSAMQSIEPSGLRRATGLAPTWPAALPMIPIDHVLVTADWNVAEAGVGPNIGSDHRPLFARLSSLSR